MSLKWTKNQSDSGILRKSDFKEKKEELFVFGYSCKLFRDNEKAQHIDQGKHLIPWMGDETLKIDRYDARGALHDLSRLEAPSGGFDWRVELTKNELDVEQLCDEERYRALHTDEDEEEMYREEELKRLHAAGYGQVGFNYENPAAPGAPAAPTAVTAETDDPFVPSAILKSLLPPDVVLPETEKLNAIIDKTAQFIATQGAQMEILLRAKQADNPQFKFLSKESELNGYFTALIGLVRQGKWPEKAMDELTEDKHQEHDDYLHPSLGSTISVESAPSIPSLPYKPSADCDYTLLMSRLADTEDLCRLAPGEVPPPGTLAEEQANAAYYRQYAAYYQQYMTQHAPAAAPAPPPPAPLKSHALSLMNNYNTDSDTDGSDYDSSSTDSKPAAPPAQPAPPAPPAPPAEVRGVIDKMAAYVARNGDEFAEIVRAKNDPRFTFLEPSDQYHAWYVRLMREKRGVGNGEGEKERREKKSVAPVSFSIKKMKESDPVLPKPALPYESSSDEEAENKQTDKAENSQTNPDTNTKPATAKVPPVNVPPVQIYKIENQPKVQIQAAVTINSTAEKVKPPEIRPEKEKEEPKMETNEPVKRDETEEISANTEKVEIVRKEKSASPEKKRDVEEHRKEKREKYREHSKSETREYKKERSPDKDRRREKTSPDKDRRREKASPDKDRRREKANPDKDKRREKETVRERIRRKYAKEELDGEVISLEENSDVMIDLTSEPESKAEAEVSADRVKQQARRRRAAEFLARVGVDPAAALPACSLASAMVDTLESLRKKKMEEEAKRRKRERRRRRHDNGDREAERHKKYKKRRHDAEDDHSDHDTSKRKRRKKDKKHSSSRSKKKKRRVPEPQQSAEEGEDENEEDIQSQPLDFDLTTTLKELRASPTKDLVFQELGDTQAARVSVTSASEEEKEREEPRSEQKRKKKKKESREYSEGEWSSDSEEDSHSSEEGSDKVQ